MYRTKGPPTRSARNSDNIVTTMATTPSKDLSLPSSREFNRAHAAAASQALPALVVKEMQRHQKYLEQRMTRLRREALRLIADDSELDAFASC